MTSLSDRIRVAVLARREIAEAATPGPWRPFKDSWIDAGEYDEVIAPANVECMAYCYGGTSKIEITEADRAHIVANGPDVVLRQSDAAEGLLNFAEAKQDGPSRRAILHYLRCAYGVTE